MMFEVEISEQADNDLREIYQYIVFELRSPENARRQLARLEKSIMSLEKMPERFRLYEKEPWHSRGLRKVPVDNFIVFYLPNEKTKEVVAFHAFYGGQNIDEIMREEAKKLDD